MTARHRVLIDGARLAGERHTSGFEYARSLLHDQDIWADAGLEIVVGVPYASRPSLPAEIWASAACWGPSWLQPTRSFKEMSIWVQFGIPRLASRISADVILQPYQYAPVLTSGTAKMVAVVHDLCMVGPDNPCIGRLVHTLQLISLGRADRHLFVSHSTRTQWQKWIERTGFARLLERPACVVHNGLIGSTLDGPTQRSRDAAVWVGSTTPRKRLNVLLDALQHQSGTSPPMTVTCVVPPSQVEQVENRVHSCGISGVRVLGGVSRDELMTIYAESSFLLSTSSCEGFGYPVIEAMSMGCIPVVLTGTSTEELLPASFPRAESRDAFGELLRVLRDMDESALAALRRDARSHVAEFDVARFQDKVASCVRLTLKD